MEIYLTKYRREQYDVMFQHYKRVVESRGRRSGVVKVLGNAGGDYYIIPAPCAYDIISIVQELMEGAITPLDERTPYTGQFSLTLDEITDFPIVYVWDAEHFFFESDDGVGNFVLLIPKEIGDFLGLNTLAKEWEV